MLEPNPFGSWVGEHIAEILLGGFVSLLGILGRRVVHKHDEEHTELNTRLATIEAQRPVTADELDKKLVLFTESLSERFSDRINDVQKTQTTILTHLLNGGR